MAQQATYTHTPDGMAQLEAAVWQAFRLANLHRMQTLYFNVRVGTVPGDTEDQPAGDRLLRASLYAKRVDVIAIAPPETWIVEVKVRANPSALGQLHVYVPLVAARFPAWGNLRPVLVAESMDADAAALCDSLGITCQTPPFLPLQPR